MSLEQNGEGHAPRRPDRPIRRAALFVGAILACTLLAKFATKVGVFTDADTAKRLSMAIMGFFFVFTGNATPKILTPLSELRCDPAKVQAFQRFSGWMWVLTGLAFSAIWLLSPLDVASPLSKMVLLGGTLTVAVRLLQLWRAGRHMSHGGGRCLRA
jgi:hypothetical protein